MYVHDGWDRVWMTVAMTAWGVVLAIVIHVAVKAREQNESVVAGTSILPLIPLRGILDRNERRPKDD